VDIDKSRGINSKRSTSGLLMMIGSTPISWFSKLQKCLATFTADSEYYGVSDLANSSILIF